MGFLPTTSESIGAGDQATRATMVVALIPSMVGSLGRLRTSQPLMDPLACGCFSRDTHSKLLRNSRGVSLESKGLCHHCTFVNYLSWSQVLFTHIPHEHLHPGIGRVNREESAGVPALEVLTA